VASAAEGLAEGAPLRSRRISAKALRRVRKELVSLDLEKRLRVPGLEPRRADLAVAGSILLDQILRRLGADEITLCDLSLREGLVLDYVARHRKEIAQADRYPDVRRRSVFELAERCHFWPEHSQQVARLAVGLFDHTRAIHGLTDREREWLEYAAILHDLGVHISYEGHHKHSYYLIKNGDLRGFEPDEIETIALVARYHRQATPKRRHDGFGDLRRRARRTVRTLAAILRLAESLDRSHAQTVMGLELHDRGDDDLLQLRATGDVELELWSAARHAAPFERMTGKPLRIEVGRIASEPAAHSYAEQPDTTARVPRQAVRRRRDRRVRENHTAGPVGEVAERRRPSRVRHGMELVRPRQGGDEDRKEKKRADRLLYKIIPPLKAGMIVLADRYAYTAFARDATRGVDRQWVRELYSFAVRPDLALYFRVPIDVSVDRLMARRVKLKFYEAGMDLGWSTNPVESFRMFQGKVLDEYDHLVDEFGMDVVDARGSITEQQRTVRTLIAPLVQSRRGDVVVGEISNDESV
jgi:Ppx/GppA phosphatase family protein/thymidylate kinase-like protein